MDSIQADKFAEENGYAVYCHTSKMRTYTKLLDPKIWLYLDCFYRDDEFIGCLHMYIRMMDISISNFSLPNKNFKIFEEQMARLAEAYRRMQS